MPEARAERLLKTLASNSDVIIGSGGEQFDTSDGGGLRHIGLTPGEMIGEEARPLFAASGPAALRAFDDVVTGRRRRASYDATYPSPDGRTTRWRSTISQNGEHGRWNFVANYKGDDRGDETPEYVGGDGPWYVKLFPSIRLTVRETSVGKLVSITFCACAVMLTWAIVRPGGLVSDASTYWRESLAVKKEEAVTGRLEAEAALIAARAAQVRVTADTLITDPIDR